MVEDRKGDYLAAVLPGFADRVRTEISEGRSQKGKENQLAEDFLRSYSQTHK